MADDSTKHTPEPGTPRMTPAQVEAAREKFEAWRPEARALRFEDGYWSTLPMGRWQGWLACTEERYACDSDEAEAAIQRETHNGLHTEPPAVG